MSANEKISDDVVDLEEYFSAKRPVPKDKKYRIRIDKERYVVEVPEMNGMQILALAGKTPDKFLLRQKLPGGVEPVEPSQVVNFAAAGVERFMTIPKQVSEGEGSQLRRQFGLLQTDVEYLDSIGLRWEAVTEANLNIVVVYAWPLPSGYNVSHTDVHIRLTNGYPDTQIDMAYFAPALSRADSRGINNLSMTTFDGRQWQQWSRHRTADSVWRPGVDDISTHMALMDDWLVAELTK